MPVYFSKGLTAYVAQVKIELRVFHFAGQHFQSRSGDHSRRRRTQMELSIENADTSQAHIDFNNLPEPMQHQFISAVYDLQNAGLSVQQVSDAAREIAST